MSWKRNLLLGLITTLCSGLLCLLALEVFLRLTVDSYAQLDANLTWRPDLDTVYWKKNFLYMYSNKENWQRGDYDRYLGWDRNIENGRIRGGTGYSRKPGDGVLRIVTIGDSFTYGAQVEDDQTYSAYLEQMLEGSEVLNMGVVAYGIDQAVLKYLQHGAAYQPGLVILGILPDDYYRCAVSFYAFSKPTFVLDKKTGTVELTNTDIPPPEEVYRQLKEEVGPPRLYALALAKDLFLRAYWRFDSGPAERYYQDMDRVVEHILLLLKTSTQETDTRLLVLQIPNGSVFRDQATLDTAMEESTRNHLLAIYEKLGIEYIDLQKEFRDRFPVGEVFQEFYFPKPETTRGHFTPRGNMETATIIKQKLIALGIAE